MPKASELDVLWASQSRILWAVLATNDAMFLVEAAAGLVAGSAALSGDSLDKTQRSAFSCQA
jgi:Co/Zn/Cd efflux system component